MNRATMLYIRLRHRCALTKAFFYDKILGIEAKEYYQPAIGDISVNKDMQRYQPAFYGRLEKMLDYLKLTPNDIFIDLGCGKGRVIFFVALQILNKVIGVEIDKNPIDIAKKNLKSLKRRNTPIEVIHADAAHYKFRDENIIFINNPFGHKTLEAVIKNIKESLVARPRKIHIVYYNPQHKDLLNSQDWLVLEGKIENDNCLVWCNESIRGG